MDDFSPSDLKTILHSKRANIYHLQHCRILVNGGQPGLLLFSELPTRLLLLQYSLPRRQLRKLVRSEFQTLGIFTAA